MKDHRPCRIALSAWYATAMKDFGWGLSTDWCTTPVEHFEPSHGKGIRSSRFDPLGNHVVHEILVLLIQKVHVGAVHSILAISIEPAKVRRVILLDDVKCCVVV